MPGIRERGLSGKARRARRRQRAARHYHQQLIADYLEPGRPAPELNRHIPIGRRNEFQPSVIQLSSQDLERARGQGSKTPGHQKPERATSVEKGSPSEPQGALRFHAQRAGGRSQAKTIGNHRAATPRFSGFLMGCALGSAAAAFMLMIVQFMLG